MARFHLSARGKWVYKDCYLCKRDAVMQLFHRKRFGARIWMINVQSKQCSNSLSHRDQIDQFCPVVVMAEETNLDEALQASLSTQEDLIKPVQDQSSRIGTLPAAVLLKPQGGQLRKRANTTSAMDTATLQKRFNTFIDSVTTFQRCYRRI